jgi:predicted nucleic acid-binding protein
VGTDRKIKVSKLLFVDSNIWCYYFDARLPEHVCVRDAMREIIKAQEIACNTVIVMEVAHYLVRHFTEKIARKKIEAFVNLSSIDIADFNRQLLSETVETLLAYAYAEGLGGRDATVIASMKLQNIKKIVSHDDIFKRLANKLELEVIDPAQPAQP